MTPDHFRTFARYNAWANRRLYEACGRLADADYHAARPAFFGSIHGTLNHLLVADRIWLGRVEGVPAGDIRSLDQILYEDRGALAEARAAEDARIVAVCDRLDAAELGRDLVYRTLAGLEQRTPLAWVLAHVFNHQTHHRGQVHGLLSQTAVAPPPLDLLFYLRETGAPAPG